MLWSFEQPLSRNTWSCLLPAFFWVCLFSYQHVEKESEVTQLCLTLCNLMDYNLPGSSVHENFQARELEWVAISFSRGSSQPRDWTHVSHRECRRFTIWATRETLINQHVREPYIFHIWILGQIYLSWKHFSHSLACLFLIIVSFPILANTDAELSPHCLGTTTSHLYASDGVWYSGPNFSGHNPEPTDWFIDKDSSHHPPHCVN